MTAQWLPTHSVEMLQDRVIKRFRHCDDREHEREWRALTILKRFTPNLAPAPLGADLSATPPIVTMTRLPGAPLRGCSLTTGQLRAMAESLTRLYESVPRRLASQLPCRVWNERQAVRGVHSWYEQLLRSTSPPAIRRAAAEGMRWLELTRPKSAADPEVPPVFGQADGNLANFLWDGASIRIVDFEASGRSDRPYELAEMVEHVSVWADSNFDVSYFVELFDLSRSETLRFDQCRRLIALMWLLVYALREREHAYNPPGTAERQAERLLTMLGRAMR